MNDVKKKVTSNGLDLSRLIKDVKSAPITIPISSKEQLDAQVEAQKYMGKTYTVIKHLGDPDSATTEAGDTVRRKEKIYVEETGSMVECIGYDNHFIYENPAVIERGAYGPYYVCTCGAAAILVMGGDDVPAEAKNKFACSFDAATGFKGKHVTDELNVTDFLNSDLSKTRQLPQ